MRIEHHGFDYSPRQDFGFRLRLGPGDTESELTRRAKAMADAFSAVSGVEKATFTAYKTEPLVSVVLDKTITGDLPARMTAIEAFLAILDGCGSRYSPLRIIDLYTELYRHRHSWFDRDILHRFGPDPIRFERLQALRVPTIAAFMNGQRRATDPSIFTEFHTGLDAYEQALVRHIAKDGPTVFVDASCADGCHHHWIEPLVDPLVEREWVVRTITAIAAGPKLAYLNKSANELMAD